MDEQWRRLQPLLPPEKPWTGRPNVDHRRILNGILWVHRTGAPWRDLPLHYGPVGTVSSRFYRWRAAGVWDQVLLALQAEADARGEVDWDLHFVDATVIRAHQHAAGARRDKAVGDGANVEALGRSQGGFSTKLHLRAEGGGKPIVAVLTGGGDGEGSAGAARGMPSEGSGMSRSRWKRYWTTARSAAPIEAVLGCGHGMWPATRATAAPPREGACVAGTSGR